MIKVSTFCSGIGAAEQAIKELGINHEVVFASEIDKYARMTYYANHNCNMMVEDMTIPDYIDEKYYADINISGLPCFKAGTHGYALGYIQVKEATNKGYDIAEPGDSINISNPNSKTRRSRVGKGIANTLETTCKQVVIEPELIQIAQIDGFESEGRVYDANGLARTIKDGGGGGSKTGWYKVDEKSIVQPVQIGQSEKTFAAQNGTLIGKENQDAFTIRASQPNGVKINSRIRRLTPLEVFRLQAFPDYFVKKNDLLKDINKLGILLYICNEFKNKLLCNVKAKNVIEKQKDLDIVLCTTKDSENTEMQISFSNIPIEETKNAKYQIAVELFTQQDFVHHITTQSENMEMFCMLTKNEKELSVVLLHQKGKEELESLVNPNTELLLKISLDESWKQKKLYITSTLIHTIMKSVIYMSILPSQNTLKAIVSYEESKQKLPQNFLKKELLFLKTANTGFVSSSQLYKQAGNTITVSVIKAIINNLLHLLK